MGVSVLTSSMALQQEIVGLSLEKKTSQVSKPYTIPM